MEPGWYAIRSEGNEWVPVADVTGRHCYAQMDAWDYDGTHVGYWTGAEWEEIAAAEHTVEVAPAEKRNLFARLKGLMF